MKYEYVTINDKGYYLADSTEHREIIDDYAEKGYRYVGMIPVHMTVSGRLDKFDLVFEKIE